MSIKGKVVKIVDEYSVVVDIGSRHGVKEDMQFVVYEEGEEITDPDTGDVIDRLEYPKARIQPYHIMEEMTVMESSETEIETYDVGPFSNLPSFGKKKVEKQKELPLDEKPELEDFDKTIEVGDSIREYHPE